MLQYLVQQMNHAEKPKKFLKSTHAAVKFLQPRSHVVILSNHNGINV